MTTTPFSSCQPRPIVILGPTAGGKSELAVRLAEHLGGQVISADSMQVYRHMDVGTAKPSMSQRQRAVHHMGRTEETRHLLDKNLDAVLSPAWSIHMGAGTGQ